MQPRLFQLNRERDDIVEEVVERVLSGRLQAAWESQEHGLELLINEAADSELSLLEGARSRGGRERYAFWHHIAVTSSHNGEDQNADLLASLVERYASDIVGQCNPAIFRLVSRVAPLGLNTLFNLQRLGGARHWPKRWSERILVQGEIERIRRLSRLGTLVFVPTHISQLDPVLLGWALDQASLPPAAYGAGKDLFTRRIPAFFMRNLGAYKFNRRLKHSLYREVLRTTAQVLLERGFHSIFFPGGSRSHDGRIEQSLRPELLEPALGAYLASLLRNEPRPVFFVPVTINYHLVLEAETQIGRHLRADDQRRPVLEDAESPDLARIARYTTTTLGRQHAVSLYFCPPLDPFGNEVDDGGRSHDRSGRAVDPARYFQTPDGPGRDDNRDREYINALSERILESYRANNVLFSVPLVSLAILDLVGQKQPLWEINRVIRFARGEFLSSDELTAHCDRLLALVRQDAEEGRVRLGPAVQEADAAGLVQEAYGYFRMYHTNPLVLRRGNGVELRDTELLYYYSNRAHGYGYERRLRQGV
ncbi:MAG: 1-acyl-sn-glycerol-3-phosphate acyltransferase [Bradymonadales bacterium]|nr:1-acyl-sn-glycerol-3-phosphate acyltransferase [Bradymonadales bacterium]